MGRGGGLSGSTCVGVDGCGGGGGIVEPGAAAADARDGDEPEGQRQQQRESPTPHGGQTHREMTKCLAGCAVEEVNNERFTSGARRARDGDDDVWRPHVRNNLVDVSDVDVNEKCRDELTKSGTKRKRAPMHFGPCEHGVKQRSKCKVCSACPHGRRRSKCKECGGASICEHGRQRYDARSAVGASICEHGRQRHRCKECGGSQYASTVVGALSARSAVGHQSVSTVVSALVARSAVGHQYASTVVSALVQGVRWGISLRARSSSL